jgi:hypothetical protein
MHKVSITDLTLEQAKVITQALDLYNRITLGQFEELTYMVQRGTIPLGPDVTNLDLDSRDQLCSLIKIYKRLCGYQSSSSYGLGNQQLPKANAISYELLASLLKPIAEHENPNPNFKSYHYDGLMFRYTQDSLPEIKVYEDL